MNKTTSEKKLTAVWRITIILSVVVILLVVSFLAAAHYLELHEARSVLYTAKVVRLSAWSVSMECYGEASAFSDISSEDGLAPGISEKVLERAQANGSIRLLESQKDGYGIAALSYTEGAYTAVYEQVGDKDTWKVYKSSVLIES